MILKYGSLALILSRLKWVAYLHNNNYSEGIKMNVEPGVLERYSAGAESKQADLCCPVDYDQELLTLLPQEIIDKCPVSPRC
jgi:hypothetical protein